MSDKTEIFVGKQPCWVDIHTHHPRPNALSPTMAGIHPWDAEQNIALPDFAECDIIGETGLDYACMVNKEAQERLFRVHLAEAVRLSKPVVLHVIKAFEPVMRILGEYPLEGVVFHGFIGSEQQAKEALRRGYYLSFGERSLHSPRTRQAMTATPLDRIFIETDDNPNADIVEIYSAVAATKDVAINELASEILTNYKRLIR